MPFDLNVQYLVICSVSIHKSTAHWVWGSGQDLQSWRRQMPAQLLEDVVDTSSIILDWTRYAKGPLPCGVIDVIISLQGCQNVTLGSTASMTAELDEHLELHVPPVESGTLVGCREAICVLTSPPVIWGPLIFQNHCDNRIGDFQAEERGVYVSECISCMPVERTVCVWEEKLWKFPCIMLVQNWLKRTVQTLAVAWIDADPSCYHRK